MKQVLLWVMKISLGIYLRTVVLFSGFSPGNFAIGEGSPERCAVMLAG